MNSSSRRPTEEYIVPALLDAAEELFAEWSPDAVGMRDIADRAQLSVGVAYRYFDSKEALIGATLERVGERLSAAVGAHTDPSDAVTALWQALEANPSFSRLVTWGAINGRNVAAMMSKYPVARDVMMAAQSRGLPDPSTVAGVTVLFGIAGSVFGPTINAALHRPPHDQRLYESAAEALESWISQLAKP